MKIINIKREVVFSLLAIIIVVMSYLTWASIPTPECSQIKYIESNIEVRNVGGRGYIGLNADRDALKFGGISSGGTAIRSIKISDPKNSLVTVFMEGELTQWTEITPQQFELKDEPQSVFFKVSIPDYTFDGNYTGRVKVCFK